MTTETLQDRLGRAIKASGLTQVELARRVGITQPTLSDLINKLGATTRKIPELARELKVSPLWLATGEEHKNGAPPALSDHEKMILETFRQFPEESRSIIMTQLRALIHKNQD